MFPDGATGQYPLTAHTPRSPWVEPPPSDPLGPPETAASLRSQIPGDAPTDKPRAAPPRERVTAPTRPSRAPRLWVHFHSALAHPPASRAAPTSPSQGQPGPLGPGPRPEASASPLLTVSTPELSSRVPSVSSPTAASSTAPGPPSGSRGAGCNGLSGSGGVCSIAAVRHREYSAPAPCLARGRPAPCLP